MSINVLGYILIGILLIYICFIIGLFVFGKNKKTNKNAFLQKTTIFANNNRYDKNKKQSKKESELIDTTIDDDTPESLVKNLSKRVKEQKSSNLKTDENGNFKIIRSKKSQ